MNSGVTRDCLKCMEKVPVDSERLNMVVIIGRIVAETSFRRKVGIGSRSTLFIRRGMQEFSDFANRCRRK